MKFPGLNEPIKLLDQPLKASFDKLKNESEDRHRKRPFQRINPMERGWAGTTWPGRHAGAPVLQNGGIFSLVLLVYVQLLSLKSIILIHELACRNVLRTLSEISD